MAVEKRLQKGDHAYWVRWHTSYPRRVEGPYLYDYVIEGGRDTMIRYRLAHLDPTGRVETELRRRFEARVFATAQEAWQEALDGLIDEHRYLEKQVAASQELVWVVGFQLGMSAGDTSDYQKERDLASRQP